MLNAICVQIRQILSGRNVFMKLSRKLAEMAKKESVTIQPKERAREFSSA